MCILFSFEISVYLALSSIGRGIGVRSYENLLDRLRKLGVHAVIAGVALPNELRIPLHEKMDFRKLAHFEQVCFEKLAVD
ncbi:hypothetical protein BH11PSE12_BH11PSE12_12850 [soil metagenome]